MMLGAVRWVNFPKRLSLILVADSSARVCATTLRSVINWHASLSSSGALSSASVHGFDTNRAGVWT